MCRCLNADVNCKIPILRKAKPFRVILRIYDLGYRLVRFFCNWYMLHMKSSNIEVIIFLRIFDVLRFGIFYLRKRGFRQPSKCLPVNVFFNYVFYAWKNWKHYLWMLGLVILNGSLLMRVCQYVKHACPEW